MSFIRYGAGFAASTLVRVASGLLVVKMMAWNLGPEAFGVLGQMMSIVAVTNMFAAGGISVGLTKRLSEKIELSEYQKRLGSANVVCVLSSTTVSVILLVSASYISSKLFSGYEFTIVISALAFSHWCVGFYQLVQSIFSSREDIHGLVMVNVFGTVLGAAVFLAALWLGGVTGAAYGLVLMPAMNGVVALIIALYRCPSDISLLQWNVDRKELIELASYSAVMLISAAAVPLAQLGVRNVLGEKFGWEFVGFWQGSLKISDVYMQFIGMILANYALPKFSAAASLKEVSIILRNFCYFLFPLSLLMFSFIFLTRNIIINLLFSESFEPMASLFLPQMGGDFLRIFSSIITYVFLSRGYRRIAILSELVQAGFLYGLSFVLVPKFGAMGPAYSYLLTSVIVLIIMLFSYARLHAVVPLDAKDNPAYGG